MDFAALVEEAARKVTGCYFALPQVGLARPRTLERVYCYELYHQLRQGTSGLTHLALTAEVVKHRDKLGPNALIPDLILHVPGNDDSNTAALEVKCDLRADRLAKDLATFKSLEKLGYTQFVWLFVGNLDSAWRRVKAVCGSTGVPTHGLTVLLHAAKDRPIERQRFGA